MTNKPISNTKIKEIWKPHKKIKGISRNKVLNFNSKINKTLKFVEKIQKC